MRDVLPSDNRIDIIIYYWYPSKALVTIDVEDPIPEIIRLG